MIQARRVPGPTGPRAGKPEGGWPDGERSEPRDEAGGRNETETFEG